MKDTTNIEGMLRQDNCEKRKAASGARHRASRTGRESGCFPHEMLKGKELRDYKGNSAVKRYFIPVEEARKL